MDNGIISWNAQTSHIFARLPGNDNKKSTHKKKKKKKIDHEVAFYGLILCRKQH